MHDPNLTTDPERSTVRRNGTVNHHRPGRSWQLHIANQYAGSQVETMVIDGNAVAVLTETGEIAKARTRRQHVNRHADNT